MLAETQQRMAVGFAAKYFESPLLAQSIIEAATTNTFQREFSIVNQLIGAANDLAASDIQDQSLKNLSALPDTLPTPFAWKDRTERNQWTASFLETARIINSEINAGEYKNPQEIESANIFRFFLLDGYARWVVTDTSKERYLEEDRAQANTVVNALCEATVVLAERNNPDAVKVVRWMNNQQWIEETWGFDAQLVERAHRFGDGQATHLEYFELEGSSHPIEFIESSQVNDGVVCDVYSFQNDPNKDLGIIRIKPGQKTPLQRVLDGTRTIEGHVSGRGKLIVLRGDGNEESFSIDDGLPERVQVEVHVGDEMQWEAAEDSTFVAYEICFPPYQDGRFENIA